MKIFRSRLTFPVLCLAVGVTVFGVGYTLLGQGPGNENPEPVGPVGQVNDLFDVIVGEDVGLLEQILAQGEDPNAINAEGATALQWAILGSGVTDTVFSQVRILLEAGANPNQPDRQGLTPLHTAAMGDGSDAVMKALIDAGGDPLITTVTQTPYELALMTGNTGAVTAIEQVTDYRPANRSFLQALGVATQEMRGGFRTSTTNQERKNVIQKAIDGLVRGGFLTEAQGKDLVRQLTG